MTSLSQPRQRIAAFDLGVRNFAFIVADLKSNAIAPEFPFSIELWNNVSVAAPCGTPKSKEWDDVLHNVNTTLFAYSNIFSTCDICLVERQMTKLNVKATKLSYHVMSFFSIVWPHVKVIEYSASRKTHAFTRHKMTKRERKQYCIDKTTDELLASTDTASLGLFLSSKKKDDLADVFQMVCSWIASSQT